MTRVWSAVVKMMVVRCDRDVAVWHYAGEVNGRSCDEVARTHHTVAANVEATLVAMGWAVRSATTSAGVVLVKDLCPRHAGDPIITPHERSARARGTDIDPRDPSARRLIPRGELHWKDPDFEEYDDLPRFLTESRGTPRDHLGNLEKLAIDPDHPAREQIELFEISKRTAGHT